jgi:hypothetical protein
MLNLLWLEADAEPTLGSDAKATSATFLGSYRAELLEEGCVCCFP